MQLNDLLAQAAIDPEEVMVLRHRPKEPALRKILPWLASERHELFNAYQQTQGPAAEKAMRRAGFVASFIGHESGKAVFVGLYKVASVRPISLREYWKMPVHIELKKFGMAGQPRERSEVTWFDLERLAFRSEWQGKLIVGWPGLELSWWRWAGRNELPVFAILEESILVSEMPDWTRLSLAWQQLDALPRSWQAALSQWRGIYYIFDSSDGRGYVGAAYGKDNLLGRWRNYAKAGHGGNKQLRKRKPDTFRFSILQLVAPDLQASDVCGLEASWKERLHTREFGLNDN